ncbi:hypothetical protein AN396_10085 [Candidatus Epulonipiscium fishelsonii]|uniref:Uncharacterized protein n=1 Tax=Candidatus Epulonipiscium fishelsonii TaxID=77094 RepID=A0ACC8X9N7_9FIRM|nr:hypothetical protein AN396_10085 [Epulopiscium sp. SCG-B11WGA-EpuloA1]
MIAVRRQVLKRTDKRFNELDNICFLSKNLYNATLYEMRQSYFKTKMYLKYETINKKFTPENQVDYRALPAKVSKMTQMLAEQGFKSYREKKKKGDAKARLPKYLVKDGRQVVNYTKQALSFKKKGCVKLSRTEIYIEIGELDVNFVRITPRGNHIIVEIGYEIEEKEIQNNERYASIDLGINNLATITSNVFKPFIINGRALKGINQYYNKNLAIQKSKLEKINLKTSKKVKNLHIKRNNKINDCLHKATRLLVNYLVSKQISILIIGYNKGWKQNTDMGTENNQKFYNIPFYKFKKMLKYKCKVEGITLIEQEERYTSQASFLDKEKVSKKINFMGKRIKRGLFETKNKILINADVNASYNILKKYLTKKGVWNEKIFSDCIEVYSTPLLRNF